MFRYLAESYAENHKEMSESHEPCEPMDEGDDFGEKGGITNGAEWYSVSGGMLLNDIQQQLSFSPVSP